MHRRQRAFRISSRALKTARRMSETIFEQFGIGPPARDELLLLLTLVSGADLTSKGHLKWPKPPERGTVLGFDGDRVTPRIEKEGPFSIRFPCQDQELEAAFDRIEAILDECEIPDLERSALFTALPCLGLAALQEGLVWGKEPPFPETD